MDFIERLQSLSKKLSQVADNLSTEEATKNALVMPFYIQFLVMMFSTRTKLFQSLLRTLVRKRREG